MYDLSWLNPTPHAIAVYASQTLLPASTQHSLPSRTLPFTWAGLAPAGSHQLCGWRTYSITSSAVESKVGGTVKPSILAVWALITSSNFDDCKTGRSKGLAPLRIRPA